jgi:hypothetical protein
MVEQEISEQDIAQGKRTVPSLSAVLHSIVERVLPAGHERDLAHASVRRDFNEPNPDPPVVSPTARGVAPVQVETIDYDKLAAAIARQNDSRGQQATVVPQPPGQPS